MMKKFEGHDVVLSSMVGSWAANLNTPESDEDWKHYVLPTFDDLYDGKMFATAKVSTELDYDVHDIRQLGSLLWKANINFISTLFGYETWCVEELQFVFDRKEEFATMNLSAFYNATMGMHYEKMSTLLRGTGNTQHLIKQYGYDTKQATHAYRCLLVLERFALLGNMQCALWFDGTDRMALLAIKAGEYPLDDFKNNIEIWHKQNKENVSAWFKNQPAKPELSEELNSRIKLYIKSNL